MDKAINTALLLLWCFVMGMVLSWLTGCIEVQPGANANITVSPATNLSPTIPLIP